MYQHYIWDFDGTLFDTYPSMAKSFKMTLKHHGFIEDYDKILHLMKRSMGDLYKHYATKYGIDEKFKSDYLTFRDIEESTHVKPFDHVVELCKSIVDKGAYNYVYTHRGSSTYKFLEQYNLINYFTEVVTMENGFKRKPDPEALLYLIGKHEMICQDVIMIGDRSLDVLSAKNAGIDACYFSNGLVDIVKEADFNIRSFSEFKRLV